MRPSPRGLRVHVVALVAWSVGAGLASCAPPADTTPCNDDSVCPRTDRCVLGRCVVDPARTDDAGAALRDDAGRLLDAGAADDAGGESDDAGDAADAGSADAGGGDDAGLGEDAGLGDDAGDAGDAPPRRAREGAIALYTFGEGAGTLVSDGSGVAPLLDLTINDASKVAWVPGGGLTFTGVDVAARGAQTEKLFARIAGKGAFSVEAWLASAAEEQLGPARIVTFSLDRGVRNFTLGQEGASIAVRVRTTDTEANGTVELATSTAPATITGGVHHVVMVHDGDAAHLYVDGVERVLGLPLPGAPAFTAGFPLSLGNEEGFLRQWLGTLYEVVVYERALDLDDVLALYAQGQPQGPDQDGDGVRDDVDGCAAAADPAQRDTDGDGAGDACDDDDDGDGATDGVDVCPIVGDPAQADTTEAVADGVGDACDLCPLIADAREDQDGDGVGDACDNCPHLANADQADVLERGAGLLPDGVGDACDPRPAGGGDALLFFDAFERDALGTSWVAADEADWSFASGSARTVGGDDNQRLRRVSVVEDDVLVEARIRYEAQGTANHWAGLGVRYTAGDGWVCMSGDDTMGTGLMLADVEGFNESGPERALLPAPVLPFPSATYTLRAAASGDDVSCELVGTGALSLKSSLHDTGAIILMAAQTRVRYEHVVAFSLGGPYVPAGAIQDDVEDLTTSVEETLPFVLTGIDLQPAGDVDCVALTLAEPTAFVVDVQTADGNCPVGQRPAVAVFADGARDPGLPLVKDELGLDDACARVAVSVPAGRSLVCVGDDDVFDAEPDIDTALMTDLTASARVGVLNSGSESCSAPMTMSGAAGIYVGDLTGALDDHDTGAGTCAGGLTDVGANGVDRVYAVTLQPGERLTATVAVNGAVDEVLYLLDGCGLTAACVAGADTGNLGAETLVYVHTGSGPATYFLVVDEWTPAGSALYALEWSITSVL